MARRRSGLGRGLGALIPTEDEGQQNIHVSEGPETGLGTTEGKGTRAEQAVKSKKGKDEGSGRKTSNSTVKKPRLSHIDDKGAESVEEVAAGAAKDEGEGTSLVDLSLVYPNPNQPRVNFDEEELGELADSIKKHGLLQPILVRRDGKRYQIIAGERRWQACKAIGMEKIPVNITDADDNRSITLALIENIQRSNLNPMEEAYGYRMLMQEGQMTQAQLAAVVSKGRSTIANSLRLLDLPESAQRLLLDGIITAGHARAILSVPTEEGRENLTHRLSGGKLTVREAEALARSYSAERKAPAQHIPVPRSYKKVEKELQEVLQANVRVKRAGRKNRIEIEFSDEDELQRLFRKLVNED